MEEVKTATNEVEGNSNLEFKSLITKRFQDMFSQTLFYLEIAFPHEKGDGSSEEKQFNAIRSKILRVGNDNIRELENLLDSFVIFKLYEYKQILSKVTQTDIISFKQNYKVLGGKDVNREIGSSRR